MRAGAERFFSHVDGALRPLGDCVAPLRVAVHWPSKPFAELEGGSRAAKDELSPELLGSLRELVRARPGLIERLIAPLCDAEVPLGPEEEVELDALVRQVREGARRGGSTLSPDDIPLLVEHFRAKLNQRFGLAISGFSRRALACLEDGPWPGNVRELETVLAQALLLRGEGQVRLEDLAQPDETGAG